MVIGPPDRPRRGQVVVRGVHADVVDDLQATGDGLQRRKLRSVRRLNRHRRIELNLLDFLKRDQNFLGCGALMDFQVHITCRDPRNPMAYVFATTGFDHQHHVPIPFAPHHAEKGGKLGLNKSTVKGVLPARVSHGLG